jgi:hypothetical protein
LSTQLRETGFLNYAATKTETDYSQRHVLELHFPTSSKTLKKMIFQGKNKGNSLFPLKIANMRHVSFQISFFRCMKAICFEIDAIK